MKMREPGNSAQYITVIQAAKHEMSNCKRGQVVM